MESLDSRHTSASLGEIRIHSIFVYPIKSLDRHELSTATIGPGNSLINDRRFAIRSSNGKLVNGKRNQLVHALRCSFDSKVSSVRLFSALNASSGEFDLKVGNDRLNAFLTAHFREEVTLVEDGNGLLLDDPNDSAITLLSEATLSAIADWYQLRSVDEAARRIRPNVVLTGFSAFEEDALVLDSEGGCEFRLGSMHWRAVKTCPRCVVPSRDPDTGSTLTGFQKKFVDQRMSYPYSSRLMESTGHLYHASVCCIPVHQGNGGSLAVGDLFNREI